MMRSEEASPIRTRSRSPVSLVIGVSASLLAITGTLPSSSGPLDSVPLAIVVLLAILVGAARARSSLSLFALGLAVFSVAAPGAVLLLVPTPGFFLLAVFDPVSVGSVGDVARWVWALSAYAASLTLAYDGWRG